MIADADVPEDPNNPGQLVEWHISCASNISYSGQKSLEFFIDGRQDDGTIWIETQIKAGRISRVKVSFWLYSEQESFNELAAVCDILALKILKQRQISMLLGRPMRWLDGKAMSTPRSSTQVQAGNYGLLSGFPYDGKPT